MWLVRLFINLYHCYYLFSVKVYLSKHVFIRPGTPDLKSLYVAGGRHIK